MSDEGFREIQLNGKQLIFLFMAVTVVLVVTFLFGVLVGRGVREGAATTEIASGEVAPDSGAAPPVDNAPRRRPPAAPRRPSARGAAGRRAQLRRAPAARHACRRELETVGGVGAAAAPAPVVQEPVAEKAPAPPPPARQKDAAHLRLPLRAPAAPAPRPSSRRQSRLPPRRRRHPIPSGPGFAVQVAAYRDRRDADTLAKQLAAKGYPAFVMDPVKGTPTALFRVRVGKYKTLKDAEAVEARLQSCGAAHERLDCPVTSCMKPLRLLLVEDSENDATLLIEYLRQGGYEPDYTRVDNEKALTAALDQHDWDLVIADYTMPGFSGTVGARDGARPRPGSAVHFRVRHDRRRDRGRGDEERRRRLHHQEQSQPAHSGDQPRAARCRGAARAIEGRRAHPPPRVLRQPDRSAEPDAVSEPARDGGRQCAAHAATRCRC